MMPVTYGAAKDVPDATYSDPLGASSKRSTPGEAKPTCGPRLGKAGSASSLSIAVTAIMCGSDPGKSGAEVGPLLPAAATRTTPLSCAAARLRATAGSGGPVKLILITRAPWATAQLSPATM